MSKPHIKLFIPGPVEVYPEAFAATCTPLVGHRSGDFKKLYETLQPKLQKLFYTQDPVYLMTSSAWGAMEAAVRNSVRSDKKLLCLCNGAFSDKWFEVAESCGIRSEYITWDWGKPINPAKVKEKLSEGGFDAVTFVHNETSIGLANPLREIMAVIREFPDVISIVDTVSSFGAQEINKDGLGIDIMLTGIQKSLALPPGLALVSVSRNARSRAKYCLHRGFYLDLLEYHKFHEENLTPSTPALSLIAALNWRCDQIAKEGLENRYARHSAINKHVADWCEARGFPLFAPEGFRSVTVVCAKNEKYVDLEELNKRLKANHSMMINTGYGKLKGKTFRISTMGDETIASLKELTDNLDKVLATLR